MTKFSFSGLETGERFVGKVTSEGESHDFGVAAWGQQNQSHAVSGPVGRPLPINDLPHVASMKPAGVPTSGRLVETRTGLALIGASQGASSGRMDVIDASPVIPPRTDDLSFDLTDHRAVPIPNRSVPGLPDRGWATSEHVYMLPVDQDGQLLPEPGANHRKVYMSHNGMNRAAVAADAGVSEGTISGAWLAARPAYGGSEAMALDRVLAQLLWTEITAGQVNSHWLLIERGGVYTSRFFFVSPLTNPWRDATGESPRNPMVITAYGTGPAPVFKSVGNSTIVSLNDSKGNVLVSGLELDGREHQSGGVQFSVFGAGTKRNLLLSDLRLRGCNITTSGGDYPAIQATGITVRNSAITDCWIPLERKYDSLSAATKSAVDGGTVTLEAAEWYHRPDPRQGLIAAATRGLCIDNVFFDQLGWHPSCPRDHDRTGPYMPPSVYHHCVYIQAGCEDVTVSGSVFMRAASFGLMVRSSGYVADCVFVGNNIGLNSLCNNYGPYKSTLKAQTDDDYHNTGYYTYARGLLITHAGAKKPMSAGAKASGMDISSAGTFEHGCIIAHMREAGFSAGFDLSPVSKKSPEFVNQHGFTDTAIYNWPTGEDWSAVGVDGLDQAAMNGATLQSFAGGAGDAAMDNLRSMVEAQGVEPVRDGLLSHFRTAFGRQPDQHPGSTQNLRFLPEPLADGVRWDTPENWSGGYLPQSGDSVDLGWAEVVFNRQTLVLPEVTSRGVLRCCGGRLTATSASLADVSVEMVGDLVIGAGTVAGNVTLAENGRITGGAIDLTGRTLTVRPRDWHGAPEIRGGTVNLGGCALVVDVAGWSGNSLTVPVAGLSGAVGGVSAMGLASDRDLIVTIGADRIDLTVTAAGAGTGQVVLA